MLDRAPPVNPEAELALLGCVLIELSVLDEIRNVAPSDFYDQRCEIVYRELQAIHASGLRFDRLLLRHRLEACGKWDASGGEMFLRQCFAAVSFAGHASYYADIVREKAMARSLIDAATQMLKAAYGEQPIQEQLEAAESRLHSVRQRVMGGSVTLVRDVAQRVVEQVRAESVRRQSQGIGLGISDADNVLGSIRGGELCLLGARPGMGKTSLAFQWARFVGRHVGPVLFASLEMGDDELVRRALCGIASIDSAAVRRGHATPDDVLQLREAASMLTEPIAIWSRRRITVGGLASLARKQQATQGLRAIFVDYVGRVMPDNVRLPRHEQIAQISGDLKWLAQDLNVPIVLLAQLKREDDATPTLSSLKESGALEQDADSVLFLCDEQRAKGEKGKPASVNSDEKFIWLIVAKNRHGRTGRTTLRWFPAESKFEQAGDVGGFSR